ncbi:cytochrome c [Rhodopirellula sp. JC740]|uniref:Cytochrome c n=1 Tax=Rhodopirellula halodulae TaxID=2894198 RepID=A0ABS8NC66_9BACT|nr:cytochrome c [Rhodopirellula sp. JC740]MCC9641004.1 cytochrome c [Rhodopirellula sp. JC740]
MGFACALLTLFVGSSVTVAQEQRARPPQFDTDEVSRVFFANPSDAFRGERPSLSSLRSAGVEKAIAEQQTASEDSGGTGTQWAKLISAPSLEDEIKRVKLRYDSVITTPGAFNGGGYQDARLNLSVLATLFAVITEHAEDVRWKTDAPVARDVLARTARNSAAGSTQVYNEAKLRKADLQDLVSGSSITSAQPPEETNEWSMIADRSPLMEYAEQLLDTLGDHTRDAATTQENLDAVKRESELLAMLGEVLVQEGMDDYDDPDYAELSRGMTSAASGIVRAIERQDWDGVRSSVGEVSQSCANCHEQYR